LYFGVLFQWSGKLGDRNQGLPVVRWDELILVPVGSVFVLVSVWYFGVLERVFHQMKVFRVALLVFCCFELVGGSS